MFKVKTETGKLGGSIMRAMTAILALALAVPAAAQDEPKATTDEEAKEVLGRFKEKLKGARSGKDIAFALQTFEDARHPKLLAELKKWVKNRFPEAVEEAGLQISRYEKDKVAAGILLDAAGRQRDFKLMGKLIRYAGDVGDRSIVRKLLSYLRHRDVEVTREAVEACGRLKARDAIDPLIKMAHELDAIKTGKDDGADLGGGGLLGGGGIAGEPDQKARRKELLEPAVADSLNKITEQNFKTPREWADWWRKNKRTFKELDP